ncbi:hypothetical protein [Pseudomonas sp. CGJS7]|uniref:hypothetical protein n=1 Tax=Pseudomonas sp. CGJS7 TaxID=3109348 RepID=UPI00300878D2
MERLKRFIVSTAANGAGHPAAPEVGARRRAAQTGNRVTIVAEPQAESGVESRGRGASGRRGRGKPSSRSPNPIERYIACFPTAREAAQAAGVSGAMLRRMRVRGYVSTRERALVMAQACRFKIKPAELLALTPGGG